ncbi:putative binding protein precursor [Thalassoglobus neptunius]|uniref:Putative binding protein n=1 Tax=Thalassoglobus neptunius TaxID=1938619 RepID=A0A5C5W824_9PLAN|nr:molybdate ABC transporter substrate-binding protein [Thalassoglobus neptunius]TWT46335.1 putative binding protein precursor [Thalassoglobus neptunius]
MLNQTDQPKSEFTRLIPGARSSRRGSLHWQLLFGIVIFCGVLFVVMRRGSQPTHSNNSSDQSPTHTIVMQTAAGMRVAVEQIAADYEREYGVHVDLRYGGSNSLLNQIQVNQFDTSDLYLAADDSYTEKARELGLAQEQIPIAYLRPVIAVRKDSGKTFQSLEDLLAEGVSLSVGSPDQAAIGKATQKALENISYGKSNFWNAFEKHVTEHGVFKPTVNEVANDIMIGAVDAGIVWDSTVMMPNLREELEAIHFDELATDPKLVSVCVLNSSEQPVEALKFARYLSARDRGLKTFASYGMEPVDGDVWEPHPELNFFCGAVNRRGIEPVLEAFQKREGVTINTVYDGCGILTGRMKNIDQQSTDLGFPDIYMACDRYYLDNVASWFQDDVDVTNTEIVIAVPKGSEKVKTLNDLIRPGVRVSIGDGTQCTIGALTRRLLEKEGLYEALMSKQQSATDVVVEKPSSAMLVPDVVTGHVDATIAYLTDVMQNSEDVDVIRLTSPHRHAIQPFSISRSSHHKQLARRLMTQIHQSQQAFEAAGFNFLLNTTALRVPVAESQD